MEIRIHSIANDFPEMDEKKFDQLVEDIQATGLNQQIAYSPSEDGKHAEVIDGRHRIKALKKLKIDPWTSKTVGGQPIMKEVRIPAGHDREWFLARTAKSLNLDRRHLTQSQLAAAAANIAARMDKGQKRMDKAATEAEKLRAKEKDAKVAAKSGEKGNTTRAKAANMAGASPRVTGDAITIKKKDPELFKRVESGDITVNQAMRELQGKKKKAEFDEASAASPIASQDMFKVENIDMLHGFTENPGPYDMIFADPPYNIGVSYKGYKDKVSPDEFEKAIRQWIKKMVGVLAKNGTLFMLVPDDMAPTVDNVALAAGLTRRSWIIWHETFGQYVDNNFGRCHRHLLYYVLNPRDFVFNEHIGRVTSKRQELGDKRANPNGKVIDDVWTDIPRLVGNAKERLPDFPTQLPVALVRRCVEICSMPGSLICDPFCGSGTTGEACLTAEGGVRHFVGFDISKDYAEFAQKRLASVAGKLLTESGKDKKPKK